MSIVQREPGAASSLDVGPRNRLARSVRASRPFSGKRSRVDRPFRAAPTGDDLGADTTDQTNSDAFHSRDWISGLEPHALGATGVNAEGYLELLGVQVISTEDGAGWLGFSGT